MVELTSVAVPSAEETVLGRENVPLIILDDAHPAPQTLVEMAHEQHFQRTAGDFYPGTRADVPPEYRDWLARVVSASWPGGDMAVLRSAFAIATDQPADLVPIQRIPHFDTVDPQVVAAVHYLCAPPCRGTGFYRHRRTGYERIDRARQSAWRQALNRDSRDLSAPGPGQLPGDSAAFERIGSAELRFNRLILYPANCLHAGDLAKGGGVPPRLTITSLLAPAASLHVPAMADHDRLAGQRVGREAGKEDRG
ncbi:DUF6445 family protein [Sphingomonas sp.]|uniref:DUF6445 family protein n=1 Tax=Sphingomonas sp. TaxID=28214 RepID=UPI003B3B6B07